MLPFLPGFLECYGAISFRKRIKRLKNIFIDQVVYKSPTWGLWLKIVFSDEPLTQLLRSKLQGKCSQELLWQFKCPQVFFSLANVFIVAEQSRYRQYNLRYKQTLLDYWIWEVCHKDNNGYSQTTESITLQTCANVYITDMAKQRMENVFIFTRILVPPLFPVIVPCNFTWFARKQIFRYSIRD